MHGVWCSAKHIGGIEPSVSVITVFCQNSKHFYDNCFILLGIRRLGYLIPFYKIDHLLREVK